MRSRLELLFDAVALLLAKASFIGLRLAALYLLANDVDRATFGLLALGMTVADLCRFLGDWGSDTFGLRMFSDPNIGSAARAYRTAVRARFISTAVAFGTSLLAVALVSRGLAPELVLLVSMTAVSSLWLNTGINWLQARKKLRAAVAPLAALGVAAIATQVWLSSGHSTLNLRFSALVVSELLMSACVVWTASRHALQHGASTEVGAAAALPVGVWFRQATPIAWSTLLAVAYFRFDQLWVSRTAAPQVLGDYTLAARMIDPLMFVAVSITSTIYARTSTVIMAGSPLEQVRAGAIRMLLSMLVLALTMAAGVSLFAVWGLPAFFPGYGGATVFVCLGSLTLIFRCMNLSLTALMQAAGKYRLLLRLTLFNTATTLAFVGLGGLLGQAKGVAVGVALVEGTNTLIQLVLFGRIYRKPLASVV